LQKQLQKAKEFEGEVEKLKKENAGLADRLADCDLQNEALVQTIDK